MRNAILATIVALAACKGGGGASLSPLVGQAGVKTLVNLHPDEGHARLYSSNYLREGFIERCTDVTIDRVNTKQMVFTVTDTGRRYTWLFQTKLMVESISQNLDKFFGTQCSESDLANLSEIDRKGIKNGEVYEGMSRQGVIYAIGYPPSHETPKLELDTWKYWKNRFDTMNVHFEGDKVSSIEN
jgi:hypothetical protein